MHIPSLTKDKHLDLQMVNYVTTAYYIRSKVVFPKQWGFGNREIFPSRGSHESQKPHCFRETTLDIALT